MIQGKTSRVGNSECTSNHQQLYLHAEEYPERTSRCVADQYPPQYANVTLSSTVSCSVDYSNKGEMISFETLIDNLEVDVDHASSA